MDKSVDKALENSLSGRKYAVFRDMRCGVSGGNILKILYNFISSILCPTIVPIPGVSGDDCLEMADFCAYLVLRVISIPTDSAAGIADNFSICTRVFVAPGMDKIWAMIFSAKVSNKFTWPSSTVA